MILVGLGIESGAAAVLLLSLVAADSRTPRGVGSISGRVEHNVRHTPEGGRRAGTVLIAFSWGDYISWIAVVGLCIRFVFGHNLEVTAIISTLFFLAL